MHPKFLDTKEFQGSYWNALNPFNSNSMTLNLREGLRTFPENLALCVPSRCRAIAGLFSGTKYQLFSPSTLYKKGLND